MNYLMGYSKIAPLGERDGLGTFDTFYDNEAYKSFNEAGKDVVIVDFVEKDEVIYFRFTHKDKIEYHRLQIQHFPAGIDAFDDHAACVISDRLIKDNK